MKKASKKYVKVIALLLCIMVALSFASCSCSKVSFDFSKLKYEGYDYEEIIAVFDGYEQSIKTTNTVSNINTTLVKAQSLVLDVALQYQLIRLEYQKDMSNVSSINEHTKVLAQYNVLVGIYYKLFALGLENEAFAKNYSDEYIAYVRSQSEMRDETYNALTEQSNNIVKKYNALSDNTEVTYTDGKTYNYDEMVKSTTTREARNAWYTAYSNAAGELLIELRDTNNELAKLISPGTTYAELAYGEYERDYTPEKAKDLHKYVKTHFNGMYGKITGNAMITKTAAAGTAAKPGVTKAAASYNTEIYRPGAVRTAYDPASVQPAAGGHEFKAEISQSSVAHPVSASSSTLKKYFKEVSGDMYSAYKYMDKCNLYVTTSSENENAYTGAYTTLLAKYDVPYIYQYLSEGSGDSGNLSTFVHEFGHFYAFSQNGSTSGSLDINEIQSQANEWLFTKYYAELFNNPDKVVKDMLASDVLFSVQMGCILDELQQVVYSDASITKGEQVTELFEKLLYDYGAYRYLSGYDFKYWWANVPHTFSSPFYYISYAISALPSLEIYKMSEGSDSNRSAAVKAYNNIVNGVVMSDGSVRTFSGLLSHVGINSPFTESTISSLASFIKNKCGVS